VAWRSSGSAGHLHNRRQPICSAGPRTGNDELNNGSKVISTVEALMRSTANASENGKKPLLLFLTRLSDFNSAPIAATLAWACQSSGWLFDVYYDSYHQGVHFPGGDWRTLDLGKVTGGTVCADRHFEEFYLLLHQFDVSIVATGESLFHSSVKRLGVPVVIESECPGRIYQAVFAHLGIPLPETIVMTGVSPDASLKGLQAFLTPEIWLHQGLGVPEGIPDADLAEMSRPGSKIVCVCVRDSEVSRLQSCGYAVEVVDRLYPGDDYLSVTGRLARRRVDQTRGWLLGDPVLACHWIPKACEDRLVPLYGIPQRRAIKELADVIRSKGTVVYGRQASDHDFFELSGLNQSLQVVDPCRPAFQSVRHVTSNWRDLGSRQGFFAHEYSDEQLNDFRRENRVLVSLLFWNGMIRELVNLYPLMDLIATTRLRCGLVLTSESFEYMIHPPLELLTVPLEDGGVFPLVEVLLGSCGEGVGIESAMESKILSERLSKAIEVIRCRVAHDGYVPRGWWGTMDTGLELLSWWHRPGPIKFFREWPWLRVRIPGQGADFGTGAPASANALERIRTMGRAMWLSQFAEPLRPYENFRAGDIKREIVCAVKNAGLSYMFTKAAFNRPSRAQYVDDDFVALNYTAGQWDGWTPFETVNSVRDLRKAERKLLGAHQPGWVVSTIDTCQWTFGGELWKKAPQLFDICRFCSSGGDSGRLVNVKPFTLARYARILAQTGCS
jgi:hypothetical protein